MADVLVDTDVFIDHLRGARRLDVGSDRIWYSVVTRCELFAGSRVDEDVVRLLLGPFTELPIDRAVAEEAGRMRRQTGIHVADALIAASARLNDLVLATRNLRHFERVPGLTVRAPA